MVGLSLYENLSKQASIPSIMSLASQRLRLLLITDTKAINAVRIFITSMTSTRKTLPPFN